MRRSDVPASSRPIRPPHPNPSPARGEGLFGASAARLARIAGAVLGWRADEFWGATPAELAAVLGAMAGGDEAPLPSADLARLMEMFPDGRRD